MTTPFICLFVSALLIYIAKIPVAIAMAKMPGGYNNRFGRIQQKELTGWGHRAWASHMNSFESFPVFAAAVITAHLFQASPQYSSIFSVTFVVCRILYNVFYISNHHLARSTVWAISMISCVGLFVISF